MPRARTYVPSYRRHVRFLRTVKRHGQGSAPRPVLVPAAFTSSLGVRKAHGTAPGTCSAFAAEPRIERFAQTAANALQVPGVAVLEQPSPRGVWWQALGRRNIVLSQSDELNPTAGLGTG